MCTDKFYSGIYTGMEYICVPVLKCCIRVLNIQGTLTDVEVQGFNPGHTKWNYPFGPFLSQKRLKRKKSSFFANYADDPYNRGVLKWGSADSCTCCIHAYSVSMLNHSIQFLLALGALIDRLLMISSVPSYYNSTVHIYHVYRYW